MINKLFRDLRKEQYQQINKRKISNLYRTVNKHKQKNRNVVTLVLLPALKKSLSIWCELNKIKKAIEMVFNIVPKMSVKLGKNCRNYLEIKVNVK